MCQKWAKYAKKYCFRSLKSTVLLMWFIWLPRSVVYMETCEPILNSFESIWPSTTMSFHSVTNTKLKKLFPVCQHAFSQTRQPTQLMKQWFIMDHHTLPITVTHMPNVWLMFWTRVTTNNMAASSHQSSQQMCLVHMITSTWKNLMLFLVLFTSSTLVPLKISHLQFGELVKHDVNSFILLIWHDSSFGLWEIMKKLNQSFSLYQKPKKFPSRFVSFFGLGSASKN